MDINPGLIRQATPRRGGRLLATSFVLALAMTGLLASPASAADDAAGQYVLDRDEVKIGANFSTAWFGDGTASHVVGFSDTGRVVWYRSASTGRLRAQVTGQVLLSAGACVGVWAIWTYGDGTTSTSRSAVSCDHVAHPVDLDSLPSRDALRVRIELRRGGTPNLVGLSQLVGSRSEKVMEGTESSGTCAQVDADNIGMINLAGPLFHGSITYFCDATGGNDLRARVRGTLTWNSAVTGDHALFAVRWSPASGASNVQQSGFVSPAQPTLTVDLTSPVGADILSAEAAVAAGPNGSATLTRLTSVKSQLGVA